MGGWENNSGTLTGKNLAVRFSVHTYEPAGFLPARSEIRRSFATRGAEAGGNKLSLFCGQYAGRATFFGRNLAEHNKNVVKYAGCWRACRPIHRHPPLRRQAQKKQTKQHEAKPMTD